MLPPFLFGSRTHIIITRSCTTYLFHSNILSLDMTNEKSSGGTAWVNAAADAKHSTLEETTTDERTTAEEEKIEGLLINEEEHLMNGDHDEEIASEDEGMDPDAAERKALTVALVHSVVETSSQQGEESDKRYGLRKRRRPAGEGLRLLEHNQSSKDGGLARAVKREDAILPDTEDVPMDGDPSVEEGITPPIPQPTTPAAQAAPPPVEDSKPSPTVHVKVESMQMPRQAKRAAAAPRAVPPKPASPMNIPILSASSSVPNPLSAIPMQPSSISFHSSKAAHTESITSSVPCPLPAAAVDEEPELVIPDTTEKRKVTINEPAPRSRAFSIDLDLGGFDIGDGTGDSDMPGGGGRNRAFSFECFAFGINADEPLPPLGNDTDSLSVGRPRGDSIIFDPSSFQDGGIHEQNALEKARLAECRKQESDPATVASSSAPDAPVSQATVNVATTAAPDHPGALVQSSVTSDNVVSGVTPAPASSSSLQMNSPAPVTSYTTTKTTATSTTTTTTLLPPAAAAASTTSFSMDLLNKDGRIGIYLPEARKARIARFHEKRARRIWRKRIKYDCRKKLADSRPRIKGRFVKRSDMEDE